jgi:hypothetical protein
MVFCGFGYEGDALGAERDRSVQAMRAARTAAVQGATMTTWIYAVVRVTDDLAAVAAALYENGQQGWELVSVTHAEGCFDLFFKRIG